MELLVCSWHTANCQHEGRAAYTVGTHATTRPHTCLRLVVHDLEGRPSCGTGTPILKEPRLLLDRGSFPAEPTVSNAP